MVGGPSADVTLECPWGRWPLWAVLRELARFSPVYDVVSRSVSMEIDVFTS